MRGRRWLLGLALTLAVAAFVWRDRIAFELGYAYANGNFHGWTLPRDDAKAATWLRRAADAGHARARYLLGLSYARGWGVRQDDAVAERWFALSASQGYAPACYHLAWMLHKGEDVARDVARARSLMARAAAQGMVAAALALGRFHEQGEGATRDVTTALRWYAQAVDSSRLHPDLFDNARFAASALAAHERLRVQAAASRMTSKKH